MSYIDTVSTKREVKLSLKRRKFLQYIGAGTASIYLDSNSLAAPINSVETKVKSQGFLTNFKSPPTCLPLPADGGSAATDSEQFKKFTVRDELLIPDGYTLKRLSSWGDKLGHKDHSINVGYNCDHLSLIRSSKNPQEYFLVVNHEYVSHIPWTQSLNIVSLKQVPSLELLDGEDFKKLREGDMLLPLLPNVNIARYPELSQKIRTLAEMTLQEMGVSILHLESKNGELSLVQNSTLNRRISTVERQNISADIAFSFRGPGSSFLPAPRGTMANCSGATTPWNTALTCEENIQDAAPEWITPTGQELERKTFKIDGVISHSKEKIPLEWTGLGTCLEVPIDNRTYGWVAEIIPETGELRKYTALGRFRHENVTIHSKIGEKLRLYMGDDRRGGHIWRFESSDILTNPKDRRSSSLLEKGELSCANFSSNYSGRWIPLVTSTLVVKPNPDTVAKGYLLLPNRPDGGPIVVTNKDKALVQKLVKSKYPIVTPDEWVTQIESFCKKPFSEITLGDLVIGPSEEIKQLVILMDAFLMANAVGGTPTARPEDLEVHPFDESIYIAFTDNTGKELGSPDLSIFPDSKGVNSRQYGAIYRIEELNTAREFKWGKFISSGEVADSGAGFACVDNLAFDRNGNLWFVTDISVDAQNHSVNGGEKEKEGDKYYAGIFGNSSLFVVPTSGPQRGIPRLFATGPMESELTGIKFYEDDNHEEFLLLSVQHPGEDQGIGRGEIEERVINMKARDGKSFEQIRKVPIGSNFPDGPEHPPKPTVYAVYRGR